MIKLIIFGFPHCGTSILKSIIGHIEEVDEIIDETPVITRKTNKKYILCKYPYTIPNFFTKQYDDYIKIFIIRNPIYVFSSLNKRFQYNIPSKCDIKEYVRTLTKFIQYKQKAMKNLYTIQYEDLFDNHYQNLKVILDHIGFTYTNDIFRNDMYRNKIISGVEIVDHKPDNTQHSLYRTWQINQPFTNQNMPSKLDLTNQQKQILTRHKDILFLYPNNKQYS